MEYVIAIVLGTIASLIAAETYANAPKCAANLIQKAILRLPEQQRARYLEEWLAHLEDCPGNLQKLWHGMSCCYFAAPVLTRTFVRQTAKQVANNNQRHKKLANRDVIQRLNLILRSGIHILAGSRSSSGGFKQYLSSVLLGFWLLHSMR